MASHRLVVIGASVGGVQALRMLVGQLPANFPAALLVVLHIGNNSSILPQLLTSSGPNAASHALNGEAIASGHIYIAPPDQHMLVEGGRLQLNRGPKEHHARPAIDPLFRSAALAYGPLAIGIILSGRLDDGTAGLAALKDRGGISIVQSPEDATEPSMPLSALKYVHVDHCLPLSAMGALLTALVRTDRTLPDAAHLPVTAGLAQEHEISMWRGNVLDHLNDIARPSPFVCPECQGGLWEIKNSLPLRFRCHTGHAYTIRSLQHIQANTTDAALWSAIRALQEQQLLLSRLADQFRDEGATEQTRFLLARADDAGVQARSLRQLVERVAGRVD